MPARAICNFLNRQTTFVYFLNKQIICDFFNKHTWYCLLPHGEVGVYHPPEKGGKQWGMCSGTGKEESRVSHTLLIVHHKQASCTEKGGTDCLLKVPLKFSAEYLLTHV